MVEGITKREEWGSRMGLILAAAGNAVGIGNFLRFPAKAADSGGGAFMIPYVLALLLLGIPMMWVEWGIGRYGGKFGHGSTPGMFDRMWKHPIAKYLGVIGVALPLLFAMYYTFIESWTLGYAWESLTGGYKNANDMEIYLQEYQGAVSTTNFFPSFTTTIAFFAIVLAMNIFIIARGVAKGIELLAKIAMPTLFVFALVMMVRVFTLSPDKGTVAEGLNFIWNPDFTKLGLIAVWVTAAGQIFYTLSIGTGSLECYASYLKETDDVVLTGLTTSATNEFVEVILGGSISIPATAVFFGADQIGPIAAKGTFNLGLVAMPEVLRGLGNVEIFGTIWYLLLFFASLTSSVALAYPVIAFFKDELKWKHLKSSIVLAIIWLAGSIPIIAFLKYGYLDEIDFWVGTLFLIIFAAIEVIIFAWIFPKKKNWHTMTHEELRNHVYTFGLSESIDEMHKGADIKVPRIFFFIIKYITPVYLLALIILWPVQELEEKAHPKPAIMESINYNGKFTSKITKDSDKNEIVDKLKELIQAGKKNYKAESTVSIDTLGNVTSAEVRCDDGNIKKLVGDLLLARKYKPYTPKNSNLSEPATFDVVIDGLYTKPYIWGARIQMLVVYAFFAFLTYWAWRKRRTTQ